MKIKRRQSRENAFFLIFEWGFRMEETMDEIIVLAEKARQTPIDDFARKLAEKTTSNATQLDKLVSKYSTRWKLNRIPQVTLAVFRMAFCEMSLFDDIPVGATINEAVELVKKYATEDDAAYLNGILGQYDRDKNSQGEDSSELSLPMPDDDEYGDIDEEEDDDDIDSRQEALDEVEPKL